MKKVLLICLLLSSISLISFSQINLKTDVANAVLINVNYQPQFPFGNLASRFGFNHMVGAGFDYKLKKWTIGVSGGFLFGNRVKGDVISAIRTSDLLVVNIEGVPTDVLLYERGWRTGVELGRIVSFKKPNANSGLYFKLSLGYLQHKITISSNPNQVPQLNKTYRKGYDRLCGGFNTTQFIGYLYLDPKKFINFYIGIEFQESLTKGYRPWQFDINAKTDTKTRLDGLVGIKAAWIIPAYRKEKVEKFYYN